MKLLQPTRSMLAALCLLCAGNLTQAQQIHRIVGPDGRITFSDRMPLQESTVTAPRVKIAPPPASADDALPYELRQIVNRFEVTLYTGANCAPCASARNLLINRGIPFTERSIQSNDDVDALERLSGSNSLPFGTIGKQQLHGFSDAEWTQYLDAAGYPKQSKLPPTYRRPAATALTTPKPAAPASDAESPPAAPPARPPLEATPGPGPSNPAGIRF